METSRHRVAFTLIELLVVTAIVNEHVARAPERHTWAHLNAATVLRIREEAGWSQQRLAEHFGVTVPTIRHARRIATRHNGNGQS